jgi:hypothetical protein
MTANYRTPSMWDRRPDETDYAYERRVGPYLHLRDEAQADAGQAHQEFRARQDVRTSGTGHGLMGSLTPEERATAAGTHGFGGDQNLADRRLGGIVATSSPGQVRVPMIFASQIADEDRSGMVSPLVTYMKNSGAEGGWQ